MNDDRPVKVNCYACGTRDMGVPMREYVLEVDAAGRARHSFECLKCGAIAWQDWGREVDATPAVEELLRVFPGLQVRWVGSVLVSAAECAADWERAVTVQEPRLVRDASVLWDSLDLAIWRELDHLEASAKARRVSA